MLPETNSLCNKIGTRYGPTRYHTKHSTASHNPTPQCTIVHSIAAHNSNVKNNDSENGSPSPTIVAVVIVPMATLDDSTSKHCQSMALTRNARKECLSIPRSGRRRQQHRRCSPSSSTPSTTNNTTPTALSNTAATHRRRGRSRVVTHRLTTSSRSQYCSSSRSRSASAARRNK